MQDYEKAVVRYLQLQGYEQIGSYGDGFLVCLVDDDLVFVHVIKTETEGELVFDESNRYELRDKFEHAMLEWFENFPGDGDYMIYCDELSINVISKDRALIRHHRNVMEAM